MHVHKRLIKHPSACASQLNVLLEHKMPTRQVVGLFLLFFPPLLRVVFHLERMSKKKP